MAAGEEDADGGRGGKSNTFLVDLSLRRFFSGSWLRFWGSFTYRETASAVVSQRFPMRQTSSLPVRARRARWE
jgi:hypothetical protein